MRCVFFQYSFGVGGSAYSAFDVLNVLFHVGDQVLIVCTQKGMVGLDRNGCTAAVLRIRHGSVWFECRSPLRFFKALFLEFVALCKFVRLLLEYNPDLVYVNGLPSVTALLAARFAGVHTVQHVREVFDIDGGEMASGWGRRRVARSLIKGLAEKIIFVSRASQDSVMGRNCTLPKVEIVHNTVGQRFFDGLPNRTQCRHRWSIKPEEMVVLVPGTLRPVKGHDWFLAAIRDLLIEYPSVVVLVSGAVQSSYARNLVRRVNESGLGQKIRFLGDVQDMIELYRCADVVCVPSKSETFGRVVVEAMSQEAVVVATAVGGIPEIISDGVSGHLVEFGDGAGMVKLLRQILQNPAFRAVVGKAAREDTFRRFHPDVFGSQLQQRLAEVLVVPQKSG